LPAAVEPLWPSDSLRNATAELVTRRAPESYSPGLRAPEGEWIGVARPLAFAAYRLLPGQREERIAKHPRGFEIKRVGNGAFLVAHGS